jgi:regulatory protein
MKKSFIKIPTKQNLVNVALHYLQRYAASEDSLRRVLQRRLLRAASAHADFAADHEHQQTLRSDIETIIAGHKRTGALNDQAFAETKVNSFRRQGRSRRLIEQKLRAKGIKTAIIADALAGHDEDLDPHQAELKAAMALARRRKLGPFRATAADKERLQKDFAALARAGFASDIARRVLHAESPEEWDVDS